MREGESEEKRRQRTGNKSIQNAPGRRQKLLARIKDESGWRGNIPEEEEGIKEAGTKRAGWEKVMLWSSCEGNT